MRRLAVQNLFASPRRFATPRLVAAVFLLAGALTVAACANGYDTMLDSYNGHFTPYAAYTAADLPGGENFVAGNMLMDAYAIRCDGTLNLVAPPECAGYQWEVFTRGGEQLAATGSEQSLSHYTMRVILRNTPDTAQYFTLFVPASGIPCGTYKLVLTVYTADGQSFTDYCSLVIFEPV